MCTYLSVSAVCFLDVSFMSDEACCGSDCWKWLLLCKVLSVQVVRLVPYFKVLPLCVWKFWCFSRMKNISNDENWNGNIAIEIISKQLRKETWNQLGRAVAESMDLIIDPPECLLYARGSTLIAAFCLVSFWSEVNWAEARFHFCLFFHYQIWSYFLWWIYAGHKCIIMT